MVYETSTRRIYSSSPRPVISTTYSYSPAAAITGLHRQPHLVLTYAPGTGKGYVVNPLAIPNVAHRRIVAVSPPPRRHINGQNYYDMLESGIAGNFGNRIVLVRYKPQPQPTSKVLYIEDVTDPNNYGTETRLLRREHSPSPSMIYGSPWDMTTPVGMIPISRPMFSLHNIPLRSASEVKEVADLRRLYVRDRNPDVGYSPLNKALLYRMPLPMYVDPTIPKNYYIGRGNLACLSFAGGRPISKRRRFYPDYYDDKIRDEVVFRSFYAKLRDAAIMSRSGPGKRPIYQPIYYSKKTILGEENVPKRQPKESKWVERALANEKPPPPRPAKAAVATESVVPPPRKESLKLERKPSAPAPVQPVNVTLPGPRKSITEIIRDDIPKVENLPEEEVTVKMPKSPEPPQTEEEPAPPSPPPREPTPPPPKEPTPPPREPTPPPPKEPTPPPKEPTPPPREPTPPPPEEPTPTPEEATPPPPAKEATPPPPPEEPTPTPSAEEAPETPASAPEEPASTPATEESVAESPAPAPAEAPEVVSEPSEEVSVPEAAASEPATGDEASNKGEVEDMQLEEEITLDEVCDVEETDLEIESDDPVEEPLPAETPQVTEESAASEPAAEAAATPAADSEPAADTPAEDAEATPASDQDAAESPAPVS